MSDIIKNAFNNIDPRNEKFVEKNTDIVEEIYGLMEKMGIHSQKELAKLVGKKESEISKLLSGIQNMTLRSITNLEVAMNTDIILTASKAQEKFQNTVYIAHFKHVYRKTDDRPPHMSSICRTKKVEHFVKVAS